MATHDIGRHIVELHDIGVLTITGEGTRVTLSPREVLDLHNWINHYTQKLEQITKVQKQPEETEVELLQEEAQNPSERDAPIDEE